MTSPLPPDDLDARLAQRVAEALEAGIPLADLPQTLAAEGADPDQAALVEALLAYRTQDAPASTDADRLWAAIAAETDPAAVRAPRLDGPRAPERAPQRAARTPRLARLRWAVAATTLVAVAALWTLWPRTVPEVLVAEAGATQTVYAAPDGSTVTLRPYSALYEVGEPAPQTAMRYRLTGEALFEVTSQPTRTFTVEALGGTVTVLGTQFTVSTWGDELEVFLVEGQVRLQAITTGEGVVLAPGQRSGLTATGALVAPDAADPGLYLDWTEGALRFEQRPLGRILDELAQHHNVTFEAGAALRAETLSGRVLLDSLARSLEDLGTAADGRFEQTGPDTYTFTREP
ncbi:MAG: FecR domain-containing protein [Bacteroidota bacterium]